MSFLTDMDRVIERCLSYFLDPLDTTNQNSVDVKYDLMFFLEHVLEREIYSTDRVCDVRTELKQWDTGRYYVFASGYEYHPETRSRGQIFAHIVPVYFKDDYIEFIYYRLKHKLFLSGLRAGVSRYYREYTKDNKDVDYGRKGERALYLYPQFYIAENRFTPEAFAQMQQIVQEIKAEYDTVKEIRPTYVTGRAWTEEDQKKLNEARDRFRKASDEMAAKAKEYWAKNPRNRWCPKIGSFAEDRDEMETGRRQKMWEDWLAFKNS